MQKNSSAKQDRRNQVVISQKRKQVSLLLQNNLSETEIAQQLNVNVSTISRDIAVLKAEATEWVYSLAKDSLAHMYKATVDDLNRARLAAWDIYNKCSQNQIESGLTSLSFNSSSNNKQHNNRDQLNALKVVIQSNVAIFQLLQQGPTVMAVKALEERVAAIEQPPPQQEVPVTN